MREKEPRYERFARELESQIQAGTFPEGSRLPALREASERSGLSLTTVIQAYRLLETKGLIIARPQSGYYVRAKPRKRPLEPEPELGGAALGAEEPAPVRIDELSLELFRESHEPDVAQFGAATPDPELLPTARLNRILAELARQNRFSLDTSVYPEGCEELRIQIAQRAYAAGCPLRPDEILITAGCTEAMALSLQCLCAPGDLVAIESPGYFGLLLLIEALGLRALEIPARPGLGLSLEALEFALENHPVKAVIAIPNFSNPLGSLMPNEHKRRLVEMLASRGVPLLENDVYGELYFGDRRPAPARAFDDSGSTLLCSSFSKDISPGYRIGWVAAGRRFPELLKLKIAINSGTSVLSQLTIASYLASGGYDRHLRKIREAYAHKVAAMQATIEESFPEGTRVSEPAGGYLLWLKLPGGLDSLELYREALKSRIAIAPGYLFSPSHKHKDYIRLSAAAFSERTAKDLVRLGRLVERLLRG